MPRRDDLRKICVIGSGPIVIGQACEFDYSGVQGLRVLRQEGYETVLINSNPATIMTDPGWADRTYIEPLDLEGITSVLRRERPDAILPTLGGQTALNAAMELGAAGVLDELGIELIGASRHAIETAEDRQLFGEAMERVGLRCASGIFIHSVAEAEAAVASGRLNLPLVIRPAFTLGGQGGGFAGTIEEMRHYVAKGCAESPISQVLLEESLVGWGEFELEVIRDRLDNVIIVCSIENLDPMGVHTGDSVCVAPAMTLSDREYQALRDAAATVIRAVGVETGGSNVQFAVNRETGEIVVIEMNPRVSRSSALASKATGYPIAKVATKLAIGYTLDEIPNDLTRTTPASFEPTLDYVVVKMPRFAFEKFAGADERLTTQMKSVGEAMSIGRTFCESFGKALRSRELDTPPRLAGPVDVPLWDRYDTILARLRAGESEAALSAESGVHPWFLGELGRMVAVEESLVGRPVEAIGAAEWRLAKRHGLGDSWLAKRLGVPEAAVREARIGAGVRPVFKCVDSCAAEVEARTSYRYSTYETVHEPVTDDRPSVLILGSGPNRIGQGLEFDYCCVHAAMTFRALGYAAIMVNCNPETVSTDYDTSDRLYFEPLTIEDVLEICEREQPVGVVIQFGGQTPLRLAKRLLDAGVPILGTPFHAIDLAEDRLRFGSLLAENGLKAPDWAIAGSVDEAVTHANRIGYPVLVRPSYVLGGRAMRICYDEEMLRAGPVAPNTLVDSFVEDAIEIDVDAVADGEDVLIGAVMEHVEEAGVHSGDSACVIPPLAIGEKIEAEVRRQTRVIARALGVVGLVNVQFAVRDGEVFVLEANPRASRTVPFVAKATGMPLVEAACRVALGDRVRDLELREATPGVVSVKEAVLPFARFPGADALLGPEMRATGEVMGSGPDFATAFAKAQRAAGQPIPTVDGDRQRSVVITVNDRDKPAATMLAELFHRAGFRIYATAGTARAIQQLGTPVEEVSKVHSPEGAGTIPELIASGAVDLVVNTPLGRGARGDGYEIRRAAVQARVPCITTLSGATAAVRSLTQAWKVDPRPLQELHGFRADDRMRPDAPTAAGQH
jgi:carbamoyl-phosphate synthase large subunit